MISRRELSGGALTAMLLAQERAAGQQAGDMIVIDPAPQYRVSPHLYMQFMEPLGTTDSSVEAAWRHRQKEWRKDFVQATADLAPQVMRWGGILSRYYKWRETVGPREKRVPMFNYQWGGWESNQVGVPEFLELCKTVGAAPLYCVNFRSDGDQALWKEGRSADAKEAAEWVSYCNDPSDSLRKSHGQAAPYEVKLWQLGNETSYGKGQFTVEEAAEQTVLFAKAMRERDRSLQLIAWGDRDGRGLGKPFLWAPEMIKRAGGHVDMVAMHMMGQRPKRKDTVLRGNEYQKAPERAWQELQEMADDVEARISEFVQTVRGADKSKGVAVTEGHLSLAPHNANPILREWLTGVYHARCLNSYLRHGETVKIATAADYQGTRWTVNAVVLPVPNGETYFMPVASVTQLFRKNVGEQGVRVERAPSDLDVVATRTGERVFVHVANKRYSGAVTVSFRVSSSVIAGAKVRAIAPPDLRAYVDADQRKTFTPVEQDLGRGPEFTWRVPAGAVGAVELTLKS